MKLIQSIVWIALTILSIGLETIIRAMLFIPTVLMLITLQLLGCKNTIKSNAWMDIWNYACVINFRYCHISKKVSDHLDPYL